MTLQTILAILIPILAAAAFGALAWVLNRWRKQLEADPADDAIGWNRVLASLKSALFSLVTIAEREFGDKTGKLKLSWVADEALKLIPEKYRSWITVDALTMHIEDALAAAKLAWGTNTALLEGAPGTSLEDCIAVAVREAMERIGTITTEGIVGPVLAEGALSGVAVEVGEEAEDKTVSEETAPEEAPTAEEAGSE